jgi:RimJ/RimL family protein N-acetyltransferase
VSPLPVGEPAEPGDPELRPRRAPLEGRVVRLEPIDPGAHAVALFTCSHGTAETEELWTYMPYGPFSGVETMRAWLVSIATSEDPLFFAVVDRERGRPVGMASFLNVDATMRRLELGHIWYGPVAQRTRANTETAALMLAHAFDDLRYRRVEWKCDALNERSRAAALRLGFTFEGIFRRHMVVKGHNRDTAWFSMLDVEWPGVHDATDRWLDAPPGSVSLAELRGAS